MTTDSISPDANISAGIFPSIFRGIQYFLNRYFRWISHVIGLLPLLLLGLDMTFGPLIVNPIQYLTLRTGKAALIMVVITLACTPLNSVFGFKPAIKARRTFGLYTFLYAFVHVSIFFGVDYFFNFRLIWKDLSEKRYILAGAGSFLILLPLAVTSFRWWMKKLGKTWKSLHRLIYAGALLAAIHYIWLVKSDIRVPVLYAIGILLLLVLRVKWVRKTISGWRFRRGG